MMNAAASIGTTASASSMKSPRSESSSPIGDCSDTGSWAIRWISATRSSGRPISAAISSGVGFAAEILVQLALHPGQLVDRLDHVHRNPDGPRLVGDGPGDRLPDPPGRVRGELVALGVVELLDRADQPEVALLDQVEEDQAAADVALGDRHHQAQVGLDQPLLGPRSLADEQLRTPGTAPAARTPLASFSSANSPASIDLASSTSSSAVSSGTRPISRR